jgi:hypothetical protein
MKPRLRFRDHVWSCVSYVYDCGWPYVEAMGYGYTPREAYAEWINQRRKALYGVAA